jgi:hypothetical protein
MSTSRLISRRDFVTRRFPPVWNIHKIQQTQHSRLPVKSSALYSAEPFIDGCWLVFQLAFSLELEKPSVSAGRYTWPGDQKSQQNTVNAMLGVILRLFRVEPWDCLQGVATSSNSIVEESGAECALHFFLSSLLNFCVFFCYFSFFPGGLEICTLKRFLF